MNGCYYQKYCHGYNYNHHHHDRSSRVFEILDNVGHTDNSNTNTSNSNTRSINTSDSNHSATLFDDSIIINSYQQYVKFQNTSHHHHHDNQHHHHHYNIDSNNKNDITILKKLRISSSLSSSSSPSPSIDKNGTSIIAKYGNHYITISTNFITDIITIKVLTWI